MMGPLQPRPITTAGEPEDEALLASAIAAAIAHELHEAGRQVRFALVPTRERVIISLCDADGTVLSLLTPAGALAIAAGEPLL